MKKYIILLGLFLLIASKTAFAEISYSNSDQERIAGLKNIQKTIELYKGAKGYYPFSNGGRADLQFINVHITDQELKGNDIYVPYGITGPQLGMPMMLEEYNRQKLADKANFTYDKRVVNESDVCQKYYIYNWQGGNKQCYSLSINLESDVQNKGYKIAEKCYPYVISSCQESKPPYPFIRNQ